MATPAPSEPTAETITVDRADLAQLIDRAREVAGDMIQDGVVDALDDQVEGLLALIQDWTLTERQRDQLLDWRNDWAVATDEWENTLYSLGYLADTIEPDEEEGTGAEETGA